VIGHGDLFSAETVSRRRAETKISGAMIGRAAMSAPWIFRQIKHYLTTGEALSPPLFFERWNVILDHCRAQVREWGVEEPAIRSLRARLMAYSKNLPEAKSLRDKFQHVSTIAEVEEIAHRHVGENESAGSLKTLAGGLI